MNLDEGLHRGNGGQGEQKKSLIRTGKGEAASGQRISGPGAGSAVVQDSGVFRSNGVNQRRGRTYELEGDKLKEREMKSFHSLQSSSRWRKPNWVLNHGKKFVRRGRRGKKKSAVRGEGKK